VSFFSSYFYWAQCIDSACNIPGYGSLSARLTGRARSRRLTGSKNIDPDESKSLLNLQEYIDDSSFMVTYFLALTKS
jgi:hypothetical protein